MGTKVVSYKNMPAKLPIHSTAIAYLLADRFDASPVVWGAGITLYVLLWICSFIALYNQDAQDIWP